MQQITVAQFLSAVERNAQRVNEYSLGCDGSGGKCDCIGLIIGALRLAGLKWTGTHGSNWTARNAVTDLHRVSSAGSLIPGMVVFKAREPGEDRYSLPAAYRTSPDQRDYYHVGVVTSVNPLRITHCTSVPGGIKVDTVLGQWKYAGKLKQVNYEEDDPMETLYQAIVTAANGLPVRLRADASANAKVVEQIPVGTVVDVLEEGADWDRISDSGVEGFMMSKFLKKHDPSEIVQVNKSALDGIYTCLKKAMDILDNIGLG